MSQGKWPNSNNDDEENICAYSSFAEKVSATPIISILSFASNASMFGAVCRSVHQGNLSSGDEREHVVLGRQKQRTAYTSP